MLGSVLASILVPMPILLVTVPVVRIAGAAAQDLDDATASREVLTGESAAGSGLYQRNTHVRLHCSGRHCFGLG
ncbi:MAG: hypothetical protein EA377_01115 [Phycisphaerales bacterium]|nr:MAG: hypothetical protein EA377_01115 [Phycisphaerales bacterium]